MQLYLLSILYLLLGSGILLSDSYGGRVALLLSLRYIFRTKRGFRIALIIIGFAISIALVFLPMAPGPHLLGDFIPMVGVLFLTFWYLIYSLVHKEGGEPMRERSLLYSAQHYADTHKRTLGFITLVIALLHFLVPKSVLL